MRRIEISVPDLNDSFSRVVLDGEVYLIRFSWNDTVQRWSFGIYTPQKEPLAVGIRMVPRFPLNLQIVDKAFPDGVLGVFSDLQHIGRQDFLNGKAAFAFIPANQEGMT